VRCTQGGDMKKWYLELRDRLRKENINIEDKHLLTLGIDGCCLNGDHISGISFSKDRRWVCLPMYNEEFDIMSDGEYRFSPQCFEVIEKCSTFLGSGLIVNTDIYLLSIK